MEPVRFVRSREGKALGCLMYTVAGPFAAVAAAGFAGLLLFVGIKEFGYSEDAATIASFVVVPLVFFPVLWFAWRNYRQRAFVEVVVHEDRLEIAAGEKPETIPFIGLRAILLTSASPDDLACTLIGEKGLRRKLPSDIASLSKIQEVFEERVVPVLKRRIESDMASGRAVRLQENVFRAYLRIVWGVLMFPLGLAQILTVKHAFHGIRMLGAAPGVIKQGWRGRHGGVEIRSGGVASCGSVSSRTIPWSDLSVKETDEGLLLIARTGETLSLTPFAENYWPGARWLVNRISQQPS